MSDIRIQLIKLAVALSIGLIFGAFMFSMGNEPTGEDNMAIGKAFLAENAKKENIITTASGLQYEILTEGNGPSPTARSRVTVHYRGTTLDGEEFDSSYKRNEPATFPLNQVISGWTEGLQLMNIGAKFRFFIPSDLAYGESSGGGNIAPNSTLVFEVELIKF